MLAGGDRRSIGKSEAVVERLESQPELLRSLVKLLWDSDPKVSMRAADALEKYSRNQRQRLQPYKDQLMGLMSECTQQEVRWHLAAIVPNLRLTDGECRRVAAILESYLQDRSSIVRTFAMQGLFDLSLQEPLLLPLVTDLIRTLARTGTPAQRVRGRHLLKALESKAL